MNALPANFAVGKNKKYTKKQTGLTAEKKVILKSIIGSVSSPKIDLNKIRDIYKNGDN